MIPAIGMRLQLRPLSKYGKKLIAACSVWRVVQIADTVHFSHRPGPWLCVDPMMEDRSKGLGGAKWMHGRQDSDFAITKEV